MDRSIQAWGVNVEHVSGRLWPYVRVPRSLSCLLALCAGCWFVVSSAVAVLPTRHRCIYRWHTRTQWLSSRLRHDHRLLVVFGTWQLQDPHHPQFPPYTPTPTPGAVVAKKGIVGQIQSLFWGVVNFVGLFFSTFNPVRAAAVGLCVWLVLATPRSARVCVVLHDIRTPAGDLHHHVHVSCSNHQSRSFMTPSPYHLLPLLVELTQQRRPP